jgi:N-acetylglutamate synthase-like GNAT family acetyltransferase
MPKILLEVFQMSPKGKSNVSIRRMRRSDIDDVLALDKKIGGGKGSMTRRDIFTMDPEGPTALSFVAESGDKVVGFVLARLAYVYIPFSEVCLIHGIVVSPEHQGHGIGSGLVHELMSHCEEEGIPTLRALVGERDTELRKFIENLGFSRSTIINYDRTFEI